MMCKAHGIRFNKKVTIQNWSARFSIIISTVPVIWLIQRETAQILHIRVCFQVLMSTTAYGGRATYRKGVNLKSLDLKQGWNALLVSTLLLYNDEALFFSVFCCLRFRQSKARFSLFLTAVSEAVLEWCKYVLLHQIHTRKHELWTFFLYRQTISWSVIILSQKYRQTQCGRE